MKRFLQLFTGHKNPKIEPYCPDNIRIYAMGDIHGRVDLLKQLHLLIAQDAQDYSAQKIIVYLGDFIDRGIDSKAVVEHLIQQPLAGFQSIYLRGNHEQTLLDFFHKPEIAQEWLSYGGLETFLSYGVKMTKMPATSQEFSDLQEKFQQQLPSSHMKFFQQTQIHYSLGHYFFVHAGVRPGTALDYQETEDKLWIRHSFLSHRKHYEKIIVHGHSIMDEAEILPNRIGVDTGAYMSGVLTAVVLEGKTQRLLAT